MVNDAYIYKLELMASSAQQNKIYLKLGRNMISGMHLRSRAAPTLIILTNIHTQQNACTKTHTQNHTHNIWMSTRQNQF